MLHKSEDRPHLSRRDALSAVAAIPFLADSKPAVAAALTPADEVKALMRKQQDAWNRGDIAEFCAPYSDDCIFLSPTGVTRGRLVLQERYLKKYGTAKETMGQLLFEVLDTRETALMVTLAMRWNLSWQSSRADKAPASGLTLISWQRQTSGWRLVQDASM